MCEFINLLELWLRRKNLYCPATFFNNFITNWTFHIKWLSWIRRNVSEESNKDRMYVKFESFKWGTWKKIYQGSREKEGEVHRNTILKQLCSWVSLVERLWLWERGCDDCSESASAEDFPPSFLDLVRKADGNSCWRWTDVRGIADTLWPRRASITCSLSIASRNWKKKKYILYILWAE